MTRHEALAPRDPDPGLGGMIKLAVMAVGGQGGGVLMSWIEAMARAAGFAAQATSVAGVAQRTGATVYYIEMCRVDGSGRRPVFSLMPAAGDVDIVIAAEMMEAGRAIIRGFVTPDRTTLIASTHRVLAVSEKTPPAGDIANSDEVRAASGLAARRVILADFEAAANAAGSVISATLFGGLAASGALPFPRADFEAAIRSSGKSVEASLRAFAAGFDAARNDAPPPDAPTTAAPMPAGPSVPLGPARLLARWQALQARVQSLPAAVGALAAPGLRKVVDFQDAAYGAEYLVRLDAILARDRPDRDFALSRQAAKYIANAMSYDDVIRVADLKTRAPRARRIAAEMSAGAGQGLRVTEFLHPRAEEIVGMLPRRLGARWSANSRAMARIERWFGKGRRLRSDRLGGFVVLYLLGGLRFWRRRTLRHSVEQGHLDAWLAAALALVETNYDLAVEVIRARRLIKGYSDTHARGLSKYDRVLAGIAQVAPRPDAADWARRLIEAALKDEAGVALDGALATIRSFA